MLDRFKPHTTLPASDIERAKAWYQEKLGLEPMTDDPGGSWYESGGVEFALYPSAEAGTARNTAMEWTVQDIGSVVADLKSRGVTFETYDLPGVTWDGDVAAMGPYKGAWFKDSEGNILALTEVEGQSG
jgi:catechol 2,3-dioxygenase-like lactoylglutathione lyase family enzyme